MADHYHYAWAEYQPFGGLLQETKYLHLYGTQMDGTRMGMLPYYVILTIRMRTIFSVQNLYVYFDIELFTPVALTQLCNPIIK